MSVKKQSRSIKKNALLNVIKQCVGIIVPMIIYPVISRRLGSEMFGRVSFADSFVSFFILFAMLGVSSYAVREGARLRDDEGEFQAFSNEVFTLNLISLLVSFVLLGTIVLFIPKFRAEYVLITVYAIGIINTVVGRDWINITYEDYAYLSARYVISHLIGMALALLFVKKPEDYIIYAFILMFMNTGANLVNVLYSQKYARYGVTKLSNIKTHVRPILFLFFIALAVRIYVNSDVVMIGLMKGDDEVGVYSLTTKIYLVIKTLINAVIAVAIPRLSNYLGTDNDADFDRSIYKLRKAIVFFVFPAMIGLFYLAHDIVLFMGGEVYVGGYTSLQAFAVALLFAVFGNCYANAMLIPLRKEKWFAIATGISAAVNIILNIYLISIFGIFGAAISTAISEILVCFICKKKVEEHIINIENNYIFTVFVGCTLVAITCYLMQKLMLPPFWNIVVTTVTGATAYICTHLVFRFIPKHMK